LYPSIQVIQQHEGQIQLLKAKLALRIPPRREGRSTRSPGLAFSDDNGLGAVSNYLASNPGLARARTPPSRQQQRVKWSALPAYYDDGDVAAGPTLGAVKDIIKGMAVKMAGASAAAGAGSRRGGSARQSPSKGVSPRRGAEGRDPLALSSSSEDDDNDLRSSRDAGGRRCGTPVVAPPASLLRAQQAQRLQPMPHSSQLKPATVVSMARRSQEGGAARAVQAQLRTLSANYKLLRQRGAV
jgi:hypothetical protein